MKGTLFREACLYLIVALLLGTVANLLPGRHLPWWGRGEQPPQQGLDFSLLDPASADAMRTALPRVVFLDTRSATEYARGHVPGALLISYTEIAHALTADLDARLRAADAVVIYGASTETDVEQLLAQQLRLRGLAPPSVMVGGFPAWQAMGLEVVAEGGAQ